MSAGSSRWLARLPVALLGLIVLGVGGCGGGGSSGGPQVPHMPEIPIVPADDHGDTRADATVLQVGGPVAGEIETGNDVDVFRVDVTLTGTLTVSTTGSLDTEGVLQGIDGTWLASDNDAGPGTNFEIARTVGPGTYYVRVTSVGTLTGSYTLTVRMAGDPLRPPADDHGDTRADATALPTGGSVAGEIETGNDVDVFRVDVARAGTLTVSTTGSLDTVGVLQGSDGAELASDDDTGGDGNFQIAHAVTAGTYYVAVTSYDANTGSYTLTVRMAGAPPPPPTTDDHGDTRAAATALPVGGSVAGEIETGDDVDVFRVDVAQAGTLTVSTTGSLDTVGVLQGSDGAELASDDDTGGDGNFQIVLAVTVGTYYVAVTSYDANTGSYTVVAQLGVPPPPQPTDDHGDTRAAATALPVGGSVAGEIETGDDVDVFRVDVAQAGTLTVSTTGSLDTVGVLQGSDGAELASDDDTGGDGNFQIVLAVTAGTYYVAVASYDANTGSYTMSATLQADEGDTIGSAQPVSVGGTVSGRINRPGDVDYFRLRVAQSGTLTVWTTGEVATDLALLDSAGNRLSTPRASSSGGAGLAPLSAGSPEVLEGPLVLTGQNIVTQQAVVRAGSTVLARVAERGGVGSYTLGSRNVRVGVTNVVSGTPRISVTAGQRQQVDLAAQFDLSQARGEVSFSASIQRPVVVGGVPVGVAITLSGSILTIITQESGPAYTGTVGIEVSASDPFGLFAKKILSVQFTRKEQGPSADDIQNCVTAQVYPFFLPRSVCEAPEYRSRLTNSCDHRVDVRYEWSKWFSDGRPTTGDVGIRANGTNSATTTACLAGSAPTLRYCVYSHDAGVSSSRCYGDDPQYGPPVESDPP